MSAKHNQRTRAEILAKRAMPVVTTNVHVRTGAPVSTPHVMVRKASRSRYTPHFGKKQQARLAPRHLQDEA